MRIFVGGKRKRGFECVAFDSTGTTLAAGGGYGVVVVWDALSGAERMRFSFNADALRFHPYDGRLILSTGSITQFGDLNSGAVVPAVAGHGSGLPAFAPNEDWAVYQSRTEGGRQHLAAVRRYGAADQETLWSAPIGDADNEGGYTTCLSCLPNGERFVSAEYVSTGNYLTARHRIAVRSRAEGKLLASSPPKIYGYGDRAFASPASDAVVIQEGMWLRVVRVDDLEHTRIVRNDNKKHFTGIAFHPSGKYLAATSNDATVKLFDTTTWEIVRAFTWDIGRMRSICFSADGTLAAAGSDTGKVVVWDVDV